MKLYGARVLGFQSFSDSELLEFRDGFNLLVGQNNAGKSTILRALLPNLADDRHRNAIQWQNNRLPKPETHMIIELSGE
jgi:predicted ATP-dependent endonuclease of OLD family